MLVFKFTLSSMHFCEHVNMLTNQGNIRNKVLWEVELRRCYSLDVVYEFGSGRVENLEYDVIDDN